MLNFHLMTNVAGTVFHEVMIAESDSKVSSFDHEERFSYVSLLVPLRR